MVDLAKIRKKKAEGRKQKAEVVVAEAKASPAAPVSVAAPASGADQVVIRDQPPLREESTKLERFKEEAGRKREGFVEEAVQTASAAEMEVLTFTLAGEQYAVNIEHIVEIIRPRPATRIPNAGSNVVGIVSLRGLMVTLVDVRGKLRHRPGGEGVDARVIVVEHGGETLGFQVDRVLRVVRVDGGAVEAHPVVHSSEQTESIRGVFQHAGALTILLDLDKLLA